MRHYSSSILRPFGSLIQGTVVTGLLAAAAYVLVLIAVMAGRPSWRPEALASVATHPLFLLLAFLIGIIGVPCTWGAFARSRGSYTAAPTDLEIRSGLYWKEFKVLRYTTITDVEIKRGPLMRLLGTSDVKIHAQGFPFLVTLYGVRDAEELRRFLLERRESLREILGEEDLPHDLVMGRLTKVLERLEKRL